MAKEAPKPGPNGPGDRSSEIEEARRRARSMTPEQRAERLSGPLPPRRPVDDGGRGRH